LDGKTLAFDNAKRTSWLMKLRMVVKDGIGDGFRKIQFKGSRHWKGG